MRPAPKMRRIVRITRAFGLLLGGFVSLVAMMSVVGLVTDNFWLRLLLALVVVVGLPAFVAERLLRRTNVSGGVSTIGDIFAIVLLTISLAFVATEIASKPLLRREGDRYARSGSRTMARLVYFLGGLKPVFPDERGAAPAGSGSAAASASASAAAAPPASVSAGP